MTQTGLFDNVSDHAHTTVCAIYTRLSEGSYVTVNHNVQYYKVHKSYVASNGIMSILIPLHILAVRHIHSLSCQKKPWCLGGTDAAGQSTCPLRPPKVLLIGLLAHG